MGAINLKKNFEVAWRTNPHKKYRAPNRRRAANPARQKKAPTACLAPEQTSLIRTYSHYSKDLLVSLSESASNKVNYGLFA